jgi:glutamine amidotransferase
LRVSIFNYGVGNLYSLQVALKRENVEAQLTDKIRKAKGTDALLLPGVGSFRKAARKLPRDEIRDMAREGKPLFGICLGLQLSLIGARKAPEKVWACFQDV